MRSMRAVYTVLEDAPQYAEAERLGGKRGLDAEAARRRRAAVATRDAHDLDFAASASSGIAASCATTQNTTTARREWS
jgi:hypothetical protein